MQANEAQLKAWMIGGLDGDAACQAQLLRALVPVLEAFYRRRMRDRRDDIDDLVQETLIAVHTRRATFDRERAFGGWLFAIARYKMVDHFRRCGRTCPIEGLDDILVAEGFEEASSARIDIDRLLDALPAKQSQAIRATRLDGLSTHEAAARERMGESDVKVSVHRGLKALAARIRGEL
ncbi:RNA polymerase sigma-70 factor (ECF subfamily) [Novosphingobium capsulatum]|uniref:RNA polymerase sigma-70 factor (ECF subfamily) n=1 Tax=Novosphingobium capsulatum TaxID=13688 RepID=A0ABU1MTX6_9SPHN|nr:MULTISPECIES: sigma-70 family RNA polymerase sigma factor [Novosphingobium]MDR6513292.1 RNA polymerase sigma-70 factor (ECF subfamily) [Novosphingobium capsulatum]PTR07278.1 RNA polymerase ECF family sigma subunit [Novosphingobium sp. GV055]PUB00091.1 RNA polymerase ECF family sigma subunit [Novosphingobium sp. GV061]PUB15061.1 RNA polymerase ECF family sigma subunit [Novosphingobium sp. GV079]PUB39120.1 RNA polymerase ECF family sigma subunit [Novosphingobium sp. GV027]